MLFVNSAVFVSGTLKELSQYYSLQATVDGNFVDKIPSWILLRNYRASTAHQIQLKSLFFFESEQKEYFSVYLSSP